MRLSAVEPPYLLPRHTSPSRQLSTTAGEDGAEEEVEDDAQVEVDEEADEDNDCVDEDDDKEMYTTLPPGL